MEKYKKERMLFDDNWIYFFELPFKRVFKFKHYLLAGYLIFLVFWLIVAFILERYFHITKIAPDWWTYVLIYCLVLSSAIIFLDQARKRIRRDLISFLDLFSTAGGKKKFMELVMLMGSGRKQLLLCSFFSLFVFLIMVLQKTTGVNVYLKLFVSLGGVLVTSVTAIGVWIAANSFRIVVWLSKNTDIVLDFVNPAKTPGISKLAGLMSFFATLFAINVLVWESSYFYVVYTAPLRLQFWRMDSMFFFVALTIFFFFFLFLIWYFLHPQFLIINLIKKNKENILHDIQEKIRSLYMSLSEDPKRMGEISQYFVLYKEIENSRGALPLQDFVTFGASLLSSLVLSVFGNIQTFISLFRQ